MKEQYNEVEMEIVDFDCEDVIVSSPVEPPTPTHPTDDFL